MYKVLLVDDERLELNTLRNYVDWGRLGITTVYTANNGLQALELALSHRPELVCTDIRMPVMTQSVPAGNGRRGRGFPFL